MSSTTKYVPPIYTGQALYIKPTYVVSLPTFDTARRKRSISQRTAQSNLADNRQKGVLSQKAKARLKNAINWLCQSAKPKRVYDKRTKKSFYFKVNFITLTFQSQKNRSISNSEFKSCLNAFLAYARKYFYLKNYVWKIELHKSGQLHVHLTTDTFIHHKALRDAWNRIISKHGLLDEYFEKHGHYNANSTDVHSVIKIKDMASYMVKYMAKDSGLSESFKGRIWGCNYALSDSSKCQLYLDPPECEYEMTPLMDSNIQWKDILSKPSQAGTTKKLGEIFFMDGKLWRGMIQGKLKEAYNNHLSKIRSNNFNMPNFFEVYSSEENQKKRKKIREKSCAKKEIQQKKPPKLIQASLVGAGFGNKFIYN